MAMPQNPGAIGTNSWLMNVYSPNMVIIGFDPSPYHSPTSHQPTGL